MFNATRRMVLATIIALLCLAFPRTGTAVALEECIRIGDVPTGVIHAGAPTLTTVAILKAAGVCARATHFAAGPQLSQAFQAGDIDIALFGEAPALLLESARPGFGKIISTLTRTYHEVTLIVRPNIPYKSLADLKGKSIGVPFGSITHAWLLLLLQTNHMTPADVRLTNLTVTAGVPALKSGAIDAFAWGTITGIQAEHEGWGKMVAFPGDAKGPPPFTDGMFMSSNVVARTEFLKNSPNLAMAWEQAFLEAANLAAEHFVTEARAYADSQKLSVKDVVEGRKNEPFYPLIDEAYLQSLPVLSKMMQEQGVLKNNVNIKDFVYKKLQDLALQGGIAYNHPIPLTHVRGQVPGAHIDMADDKPVDSVAPEYAKKIEAVGVGKIVGGVLPGLK